MRISRWILAAVFVASSAGITARAADEKPAEKKAACCAKAEAKGEACAHKCCVEAKAANKACEKCKPA